MEKKASFPTATLLLLIALFCPLTANAASDSIVYKPLFDPKANMNSAHIPLPENWQIVKRTSPDQPHVQGPNGIRIVQFNMQMFTYVTDPYMQQLYLQSGGQMRAPPSIEQLIEQEIAPAAREGGSTLVRQYRVPELAQTDSNYYAQLYRVGPSQDSFEVMATEWQDSEGISSLILVHYFRSASQGQIQWGYNGSLLEAPGKHFDRAKKIWIDAKLNTRYNPQHIQAHNRSQMQQAQASMSAHQTRMQARQQAFQNTQNAINDANSSIRSGQMQMFRNNNAASDRIQQGSINSIGGEETMYNPGTGNSYQVESGANQYWMNSDGQYIPSNDGFYNPNMDPNMNNQQWYQMQPQY